MLSRQAAIGWTGVGVVPGGGAPPRPLPIVIHIRIATSEHRVVSPSISARASEANQVTLSVPSAGSGRGSVGPMIACQSGRRVSAQKERIQPDGNPLQSAAVEIVMVGPGACTLASRLSRYGLGPASLEPGLGARSLAESPVDPEADALGPTEQPARTSARVRNPARPRLPRRHLMAIRNFSVVPPDQCRLRTAPASASPRRMSIDSGPGSGHSGRQIRDDSIS